MSLLGYNVENQENRELQSDVHVGALCRVESFDPDRLTVDLQPLSRALSGGVYRTPPPLLRVPVALIRGSGLVIRPCYSAGDVGVVIFMDHDIDRIAEAGQESQPNTERNHSQEDAIFIGAFAPASKPVQGFPKDAMVLGAEGGAYIAISKSGITVNGSLTVTGDVTAGGVSLSGHTHTAPDGETSGPH